MRRPWLLSCVLLLSSCGTSVGGRMSYAQVQTLNPGVEAEWVAREYPFGQVRRGPDGRIQSIRYRVHDPQGATQTLLLEFDARGILTRKVYSGGVRRGGGFNG